MKTETAIFIGIALAIAFKVFTWRFPTPRK
jgi:hypothetical protein